MLKILVHSPGQNFFEFTPQLSFKISLYSPIWATYTQYHDLDTQSHGFYAQILSFDTLMIEYRRSPLRSNNSIELSMIVCVIASTIPGISMNPIIAIAQDTLF